jgi:ribosomal protein L11 methyltransferase
MNDDPKVWRSLRLTVEPEAVEAIEFALNSLDALGTEINFMRNPPVGICVVGYFNQLPDDEILQDEIHYALRAYGLDEDAILHIERCEIQNADWLAEWKKHWKPTTVGRFVIAPPWEVVDELDRIVIRIEPNMAFGTGTHETTQLCLAAIDQHYCPGDFFLDIGTGTGILAIVAAKLAGENTSGSECGPLVTGCDTDPDAIKIARENAVLNNVAEMTRFEEASIDQDTPAFDFVCANLTLDAILPILPLLSAKTRKTLVLSGILLEQEGDMVRALQRLQITDLQIERRGEWISVVISNSPGITDN